MEILFARHGNTFAPGDKVVWVGRETDLPLVEKGLLQAKAVAAALEKAPPEIVYAAALQRTRLFAEIITGHLGLPAPVLDSRLDELDYGRWAGRTNDEIIADGPASQAAFAAWSTDDSWPEAAGWGSRREETLAALAQFAAQRLQGGERRRVLVVSSNGILRFLPRLLLNGPGQPASFKMRTGHLGAIDGRAGQFTLQCWDVAPADFSA